MRPAVLVAALVLLTSATTVRSASAQAEHPLVPLVVAPGRPLRVALDDRVRLKHVGQPVIGTVTEAVYAYDRVVIPPGTKVRGHIVRIDGAPGLVRMRAYMAGNLSPPKHAMLTFDTLLLDDGREVPIEAVVKGGIPHVARDVAGESGSGADRQDAAGGDADARRTLAWRARSEIRQRKREAIAEAKQKVADVRRSIKSLRQPGAMTRVRDVAREQLPIHPPYLAKGTVYDVELSAAVDFGATVPTLAAPPGTVPAPDSILSARLVTSLDSAKTPRGTRFEAVVTEPVFSPSHQLVLPEGARLEGEVTVARPARRVHHNGQLRFLFERVQMPHQPSMPLAGALHSVEADTDAHIALDDEGGASVENSKSRFIAPALSLMMLRASMEADGRRYLDPDGDGHIISKGSGVGSRAAGGFMATAIVGIAVSQIARPLGLALGAYGTVRAIYSNILGKGREVTFPADTPIQVRLAPGPAGS